jgi:hypothetical protein
MDLNVGAFVVMQRQRAYAMQQVKKRRQKPAYNCSKCSHAGQETTDDVACCNVCEEGEEGLDFFDPVEGPFNEDDPYVVTNPMAHY